jgi:hypothetical protein
MLILLSGLAEFKHELIVAVISDEPKADASEKAKPGRFSRAVMLTHDLLRSCDISATSVAVLDSW